jgi:hypothetical protein
MRLEAKVVYLGPENERGQCYALFGCTLDGVRTVTLRLPVSEEQAAELDGVLYDPGRLVLDIPRLAPVPA